jgi:hypothetical protein
MEQLRAELPGRVETLRAELPGRVEAALRADVPAAVNTFVADAVQVYSGLVAHGEKVVGGARTRRTAGTTVATKPAKATKAVKKAVKKAAPAKATKAAPAKATKSTRPAKKA